jgi:hypothetical protein
MTNTDHYRNPSKIPWFSTGRVNHPCDADEPRGDARARKAADLRDPSLPGHVEGKTWDSAQPIDFPEKLAEMAQLMSASASAAAGLAAS